MPGKYLKTTMLPSDNDDINQVFAEYRNCLHHAKCAVLMFPISK